MKDLPYIIALTKIELLGNQNIKYLISYCGSPKLIFNKSSRELTKIPGIGNRIANNIIKANPKELSAEDILFIATNEIQVLYYLNDDYPERLKRYDDCPILLYYKGSVNLNHHRIVSLVGTRRATEYGKMMVDRIVEGLKKYDVLILSGLAYGIDTATHQAAVKLAIPTVGVVAHGQDIMYPAQNKKLAKKMILNGGILTEYPINSIPAREHFPMRNRIIAGLSDVVIVVESALKGGSIITAEFANNYNKDVFAIPGRSNDKYSVGCNKLIKSHKAQLLESAADIGYIMRWDEVESNVIKQTSLFNEMDEIEKSIVDILELEGTLTIDHLNDHINLQLSILASKLLSLEFKGAIKCLPGKKYSLI